MLKKLSPVAELLGTLRRQYRFLRSKILTFLKLEGATVLGLDPFYSEIEIVGLGFEGEVKLNEIDGVIEYWFC